MLTKVRIPQTILDKKGRAKLWHIEREEWLYLSPVDAGEALSMGKCSINEDGSNEYDANPTGKPLDALEIPDLREMLYGMGYEKREVDRLRKAQLVDEILAERAASGEDEDEDIG